MESKNLTNLLLAVIAFIFAFAIPFLDVHAADEVTERDLYTYKAIITDVYDGDSVTADIDLGFYTWRHEMKLRLYGINAPEVAKHTKREVSEEEKLLGLASRDFLRKQVLNQKVLIRTIKSRNGNDRKGSLKRYLVIIFKDDVNINQLMISEGHAVKYTKKQ